MYGCIPTDVNAPLFMPGGVKGQHVLCVAQCKGMPIPMENHWTSISLKINGLTLQVLRC